MAIYCVKSVRIRSFSGQHFPAFGLNAERYGVSLHIQSECGKIRTRKTPNTVTFHVVLFNEMNAQILSKRSLPPLIFLSKHFQPLSLSLRKCTLLLGFQLRLIIALYILEMTVCILYNQVCGSKRSYILANKQLNFCHHQTLRS